MPRFDNAIVQWVHIKGEILYYDFGPYNDPHGFIFCSCGWYSEENAYDWNETKPDDDLNTYLVFCWIQHLKSVKQ